MENRLKIFNYDNDKLKEIVDKSKKYSEIFKKMSIINNHTLIVFKTELCRKIDKLKIDRSHIEKRHKLSKTKNDLKRSLVENSKRRPNSDTKYHLYEHNLKEEKCEECGQGPEWNGKPLVLQLDHINGICTDNRLENLRILCGHCHSQTETFSTGQKAKDKSWVKPSKEDLKKDIEELKTPKKLITKYGVCYETMRTWIKAYDLYHEYIKENDEPTEKVEYKCSKCNKEITFRNKTNVCRYCKSNCPSKEQLIEDLKELKTRVAIGAKYNVTDNSVKKWCRRYELL